MRKLLKPIQRFGRRLFGSLFRNLPPEFGDPVPPDLRLFEAKAEEAQHHARGKAFPSLPARHVQTKPVRHNKFLERE